MTTMMMIIRAVHWIRLRPLFFVRVIFFILIAVLATHRYFAYRLSHQTWVPAPSTTLSEVRTCPKPEYPTLLSSSSSLSNTTASQQQQQQQQPPKICLTTLTDEASQSLAQTFLRWRSFAGLLAATWQNKLDYVNKHGYYLFDESAKSLDKSRPPSWSKIKAVQRLLQEENCEWVFWMDADTVIMNSNIRIESFLPENSSSNGGGDLLIAHEGAKGYNAGAWIVRNSPWTFEFLKTWWDMKSYVKPPGLAKSGDNDALKALLTQDRLSDSSVELIHDHVLVPPQCTFNAFAKWLKPEEVDSIDLKTAVWYQSEHWYHKGDFVAHVAGVDNKLDTIQILLELAT